MALSALGPYCRDLGQIFSSTALAVSKRLVFNNKDISIYNHTIFCRNWFDRGIYLEQNILKADGKFFSYTEFIQKYDLRCNFLIYFLVVSAIPRHLAESANRSVMLLNSVIPLSPEIL